MHQNFESLLSAIRAVPRVTLDGSISALGSGRVDVVGLERVAKIGDMVEFCDPASRKPLGEILALKDGVARVLPEAGLSGLALNDRVKHLGPAGLFPCDGWIGRIIDPFLRPLDGRPLPLGRDEVSLKSDPPPASRRGKLGGRLRTGLNGFDTLLPIVRGQRIGLFAGSGVGKSTLLADLAQGMEADVVIVTLIGERGRELREFVDETLGSEGMARSVIFAATADQSPMLRRRSAWVAMATAEYFRDRGANVLLLMDSVTRFAEAHREIAASVGEPPSIGGFPPSTAQELMALCERAGPGIQNGGSITGVFTVLVAASDMEGPIADIMRGTLDGHVILDRAIAERGRFPAIDFLQSVSRSLPKAANAEQNQIINRTKSILRSYADAELMIQAGLYQSGSVPETDQAINLRPPLEVFLSKRGGGSVSSAFSDLEKILNDKHSFAPEAL